MWVSGARCVLGRDRGDGRGLLGLDHLWVGVAWRDGGTEGARNGVIEPCTSEV